MKKQPDLSENKMELLAPAGSDEAFFAAVRCGANAVYLGLQDANARIRAKNFSLRDLETIIPFAHENNVKVYITLNTLIKQREIRRVLETILRLAQIGPDALIVQDLGVAFLAARYAPNIPLHASTQMMIHSSAGAKTMERLGFERVILARECTLDEIMAVREKTNVEVEVFAHGALCYSYSGQCYFSSFLGGASANRGRCTQPCRRSYGVGKGDGAYFSLKDICLIDKLPALAEAGVSGIKIEGRLKNASYIENVVSAYRMAIDALPALPSKDAIENAVTDFGRAKCGGYLDMSTNEQMINPAHTAGTGRFLGKVLGCQNQKLMFSSGVALRVGDRLRVTPKFEGERGGFNIKELEEIGIEKDKKGQTEYKYSTPFLKKAAFGDLVFLIGRKPSQGSPKIKRLEKKYRIPAPPDKNLDKKVRSILQQLRGELQGAAGNVRIPPKRFVRVAMPPTARDIIRLIDRRVEEYIVPLKHREVFTLPRSMRNQVVLRVPVFTHERELPSISRKIKQALDRGFTRYLIGNMAHFELFRRFPKARIQADYSFGILNAVTLLSMTALGIELGAISVENDARNLKELLRESAGFPLELVAYGRPPLFTSRAPTPTPKSRGLLDVHGRDEDFTLETYERLTIVRPKQAVALMGVLKPHQVSKLMVLRLELAGNELQKKEYDRLRNAVTKWAPVKQGKAFNYHPRSELK